MDSLKLWLILLIIDAYRGTGRPEANYTIEILVKKAAVKAIGLWKNDYKKDVRRNI